MEKATFERMLKEANVPAVKIAEALGVSPQTLTPYLQGKKGVKPGLRSKIAEALGYERLELWVPAEVAPLVKLCAEQWQEHAKKAPKKRAKKIPVKTFD